MHEQEWIIVEVAEDYMHVREKHVPSLVSGGSASGETGINAERLTFDVWLNAPVILTAAVKGQRLLSVALLTSA